MSVIMRSGHGSEKFCILEGPGKQAKLTTTCGVLNYEASREKSEGGMSGEHGREHRTERT